MFLASAIPKVLYAKYLHAKACGGSRSSSEPLLGDAVNKVGRIIATTTNLTAFEPFLFNSFIIIK